MPYIKRHLSIFIIVFIVVLVLGRLSQFVDFNLSDPGEDLITFVDVELSDDEADLQDRDFIPGIEYVTGLTGLWAIRFLVAAFLMSPLSLLIGRGFSIYFRQSLGIATGLFSLLHALVFIVSEGFLPVFTRFELVFGFLAFVIISMLTLTSSRRAMKLLKHRWKSLHRWVYLAVLLVISHLILLDQSYTLYAVLFGLGFLLRLEPIKKRIQALR